MGNSPDTRPTLLVQLRDTTDQDSWSKFVELYAPLVHGFLTKRGVQSADAADLTQEIMMAIAKAARTFEYDPSKGSFRRWLLTVVHNRLRDFRRKKGVAVCGQGGTDAYDMLMQQPASNGDDTTDWDQAYDRRLFQFVADQVREDFQESTWSAFWRTCVECESAKNVAEDLGISAPAVYMAKRRVVARIREQIALLEGEPQ